MDDQVALVADGLKEIDMESSPSAIENFNRAVRKLRQKSNTDPAISVSSLDSPKYDRVLINPFNQRALLEAVDDLKERVAPLTEQCSELKNLNDVLNRQLDDVQSQNIISRDKLKKAKLSLQTEKEETKRLRLAVERQRKAKEEVETENRGMKALLDAKDKEVSYLVLSLH